MSVLRSRDNARVRRWRKLAADPRERRRESRAIIEGAHLVAASLDAGIRPEALLVSEAGLRRAEIATLARRAGASPVVLSEAVFRFLADAETPAGIAAEIPLPAPRDKLENAAGCVFLDAIQDSGNVGAILRSAAAFGLRHVVLGRGCADPWAPKTLRAAMGAHFALQITTVADLATELQRFGGLVACAVPRSGTPLAQADLSGRIGWIFGAEGQGVSERLAESAALRITIPMERGTESLNVAAAAAICFYEQARQTNRAVAPAEAGVHRSLSPSGSPLLRG
jgi:TrmH family RNA methyltransferase